MKEKRKREDDDENSENSSKRNYIPHQTNHTRGGGGGGGARHTKTSPGSIHGINGDKKEGGKREAIKEMKRGKENKRGR